MELYVRVSPDEVRQAIVESVNRKYADKGLVFKVENVVLHTDHDGELTEVVVKFPS